MSSFVSECIAAAVLVVVTAGAGAVESAPLDQSFKHRMAQGRFLLEAGRMADALREFEAAATMPEGRKDAEVHTLLARVRLDLGRIAGAVAAVRTARVRLGGEAGPELLELHEFLTTRFGKVLVIGGGAAGAQLPEPIQPILDPELKRLFAIALNDFRSLSTQGSTSLYLPVGSYRVGSHIVVVEARKTVRMDVRPGVGSAGGGVYGERAREGSSSTDVVPTPDTENSVGLHLGFGGHGFVQQGAGAGGGWVSLGAEGMLATDGPFVVLRAAFLGDVRPLERLSSSEGEAVTVGVVPSAQFAWGLGVPTPDGGLVSPMLAAVLGYGFVVPESLPSGYVGPTRYLSVGGDFELRFRPPTPGPVQPEVGGRFHYRELLPGDPGADERPHAAVGGGLIVALWIAP